MTLRVWKAVAATLVALVVLSLLLVVGDRTAPPAGADSYVPVSGAGSTWSANALNQWIADVQQVGMRVNYAPTGSSDGRHQFLQGTVDFAASDIPFQSHPEDGSAPEQPASGSYAYMPITAGGTVFMYNLLINGQRVTNLRMSGENVVKIFTGVITNWNDPALQADNPGLRLPSKTIVPVVRSDGSGSTAQLTLWMIAQYPSLWNAYCNASGRAPACGSTSYYPTVNGMIAQSGDLGVAGYVAQGYANGAIGYVNYSYALNAHFPVVKLLNVAGYYTEPTPQNVAVSLLQAAVDTTDVNDPSRYLTQQLGSVYTDSDPRAYELSSYSYLILPTTVQGQFSTAKGKTLAAFAYYAMCQGQQESASLGYSPMPVNLVQASFDQIKKIPGAVVENINITSCNNPTFSPSSPNLLADTAPMPQACDKQGTQQCSSGTGGAANQSTAVSSGSSTSGSSSSGSSSSGSSTSGSSSSRSSGSTGSGSGPSHAGTGTRSGSTRAPAGTIARTGATSAAGTGATAGGTGSAGTGGSTAGSSGTAGATGASTSATECDPSAGTCGGGAGSGSGGAAADPSGASTQSAAATPYTLTASGGWTGTQTLMVLVGILVVGLVVAPGVVYAYLASRDE